MVVGLGWGVGHFRVGHHACGENANPCVWVVTRRPKHSHSIQLVSLPCEPTLLSGIVYQWNSSLLWARWSKQKGINPGRLNQGQTPLVNLWQRIADLATQPNADLAPFVALHHPQILQRCECRARTQHRIPGGTGYQLQTSPSFRFQLLRSHHQDSER